MPVLHTYTAPHPGAGEPVTFSSSRDGIAWATWALRPGGWEWLGVSSQPMRNRAINAARSRKSAQGALRWAATPATRHTT